MRALGPTPTTPRVASLAPTWGEERVRGRRASGRGGVERGAGQAACGGVRSGCVQPSLLRRFGSTALGVASARLWNSFRPRLRSNGTSNDPGRLTVSAARTDRVPALRVNRYSSRRAPSSVRFADRIYSPSRGALASAIRDEGRTHPYVLRMGILPSPLTGRGEGEGKKVVSLWGRRSGGR